MTCAYCQARGVSVKPIAIVLGNGKLPYDLETCEEHTAEVRQLANTLDAEDADVVKSTFIGLLVVLGIELRPRKS